MTDSKPVSTPSRSKRGFPLVMKWSGIFLITMVAIGLIYRLLVPVQLHLAENEYSKFVFPEFDTEVWRSQTEETEPAGVAEEGSLLYVIGESDHRYLVRPLNVTVFDSVWIDRDQVIDYSRENYRIWNLEKEGRVYNLED